MDRSGFAHEGSDLLFSDVLDSFKLSSEEKLEATRVQCRVVKHPTVKLKALAETTSNAGVQYVMLDDSATILHVLGNPNLSPLVAAIFFDRVKKKGPWTNYESRFVPFASTTYHAIENLFRHKVVLANVRLFMQGWDAFKDFKFDEPIMQANSLRWFLEEALHFNPTNGMSIETLLFILTCVSELPDDMVTSKLCNRRDAILENRKTEIDAWIKTNMPDYSDVPLSWVIHSVNLPV